MPVDLLREAVDIFFELPGQPRLPDPRLPQDRDQSGTLLTRRGMKEVLEQAKFLLATHERSFEAFGSSRTATRGDHAERSPGWHWKGLALEHLVIDRLEQ